MTAILALLMKFGPSLLMALPHLGDIINTVESLFGTTTSTTNGETKLQLAMDLLQKAVPELEDAFNVDQKFRDVVAAGISFFVQIMQLLGTVTGVAPTTGVVAVAVAANPAMIAAAQASTVQQP